MASDASIKAVIKVHKKRHPLQPFTLVQDGPSLQALSGLQCGAVIGSGTGPPLVAYTSRSAVRGSHLSSAGFTACTLEVQWSNGQPWPRTHPHCTAYTVQAAIGGG